MPVGTYNFEWLRTRVLKRRENDSQNICITNMSQHEITEDHKLAELLLMYFIGAATETTILSSGKLSIKALRRLSYSSDGIPAVSSLDLTNCGSSHQFFLKMMWLPGPTEMWMRLEDGLAIYWRFFRKDCPSSLSGVTTTRSMRQMSSTASQEDSEWHVRFQKSSITNPNGDDGRLYM